MSSEEKLHNAFQQLEQEVSLACASTKRDRKEVEVVAVSKFHPSSAIASLAKLGQTCFGESRVQELEKKALELASLPIDWHFVGALQKNKVRKVVQLASCIHSIDQLSLAERIGRIAGEEGKEICGFIQVLLAEEQQKSGIEPELLKQQFADFLAIPHLQIRGLMCLPPPVKQVEQQREFFAKLRQLRDELEQQYQVKLPALSMGMSNDFAVAIQEGATHIRPGRILFGERDSKEKK